MGNIKCLQCGEEITMISTSACPNCGMNFSHVKISFLAYIGPEDSLSGYQRSYKLVLLKSLFEELLIHDVATVIAVARRFKEYYLARHNAGIIIDKNIDDRIANITDATLEDVVDVIKINPYNAIHKQNFLSIKDTELGEVFALQKGIDALSEIEKRHFIDLMNVKLDLYYKKINSHAILIDLENTETDTVTENTLGECPKQVVVMTYPTLEDMGLSNRSYNAIRRHRITTFEELLATIETGGLEQIRNLGRQSINEILALVAKVQNGGIVASGATVESVSFDKTPQEKLIVDYFTENKFATFREYCKNHDIVTVQDLKELDFVELMKVRGFGTTKIAAIKERMESIDDVETVTTIVVQATPVQIHTFDTIHETNEILSISILRFFGVSKSTVDRLSEMNLATLGMLKNHPQAEIAQATGIYYTQLEEALRCFNNPLIDIVAKRLEKLSEDKLYSIYVRRAEGNSLQQIGEEYGLTRERIRRQCEKFERSIRTMVMAIAQNIEVQNGDHYIKEEQVLAVFDNDDYDKIMTFALNNSDAYICVAGVYFNKLYYPNAERDLIDIVSNIVGEGINLFDEIERIESELDALGYGFINAEDFLNIVIEFNYKFYGDYVVKNKKSYTFLCSKIIEKYFPEGITNDAADMQRLKALTEQEYGKLDMPDNDRSVWTRVTEVLVQCGRSKYISPSRICIEKDVLTEIKSYIDNSPLNELFFKEIFAEFEGILFMTSNVDNAYFLHGVLAYYYPNEYIYSRDSLSKHDSHESVNLAGRIRSYIASEGKPVTKVALQTYFPGFAESVLFNAIFTSKDVMQWEYNVYNCMDNIVIDDVAVIALKNKLLELLNNNNGYCSEQMLFNATKDMLNEFFANNNVCNAQNLFYLSYMLFDAEFDFRRPHIAMKKRFASLNVKDIIMELIGAPDYLHYDEYIELTNKLMIPIVTAGMVFNEIEKDYLRVSQNDYIRKSCFSIDDECISLIKELIVDYSEEHWYLPLQAISDADINISGISMNEFFMESLINEYGLGWRVVQPRIKDRRYQKGILVHDDVLISEYAELIAKILNENCITSLSESQLLSYLQIHQLAGKVLPKELFDSEYFKRDDGGYILIS